jgi:hypothetical protein
MTNIKEAFAKCHCLRNYQTSGCSGCVNRVQKYGCNLVKSIEHKEILPIMFCDPEGEIRVSKRW